MDHMSGRAPLSRPSRRHAVRRFLASAAGLLSLAGLMILADARPLAAADRIAGIDCLCDKTGDYVAPHRGRIIETKLETIEEGFSPNGIYRLVAAPGQITLYETSGNGAEILQISYTSQNVGWGFSPDDHRFVFHYIAAGKQVVELYDLRQRPVDLVQEIDRTVLAGDSSQIRFSPNGIYLFYIAETHDGTSAVTVLDTTGVLAHSSSFTHSQGVGLEGDTFRNATWGFSRDDHDRTLVLAWTTGDNSVQFRMVNLAARQAFPDIPVTYLVASFWRFSRCGDAMGLYIQEAGYASPAYPNPVRIRLIRTRDGHQLFHNTFSSIDYTVFASDQANHKVTIGTEIYTLVANQADDTCPVDPEPVAELTSLTLAQTSVLGGHTVEGTVVISEPAPPEGFAVALASNRSAATVPPDITIPAGETQRGFNVSTVPVSEQVIATISASAQGTSLNRQLTIRPPRLIHLSLDNDALYSGNPGVLRLELDGPAPDGGVAVSLEHPAGDELELPSSATIWAGNTKGSVWFETRGIAAPMDISITATLIDTRSATLHLMPAELEEIRYDFEIFSPCVLRWSDHQAIGGRDIGYRVELNGEAPPDGAVIALTSSDPSVVSPPANVVIGGRERSVLFQITTAPVNTTQAVPFQASYRQRVVERALTLVEPPVQYIMQELRPPGSSQIDPVAMNEVGQILLRSYADDHYYLWQNGLYTPLHFPAPDGMRAVINDFNDRGQYLGILREIIYDRGAAIWEDGVRHPLRLPSGVTASSAVAINNKGQVAGSYVRDNHRHVVRWTNRQPTELTTPDHLLAANYILIPKDINASGKVTTSGWRYTQNYHLPYWISTLHDRDYLRFFREYGYAQLGGTFVNNHDVFTGGATQIFRPDGDWHTEIIPPLQTYHQHPFGINDREEIVGLAQFDDEVLGITTRQAIRVTAEGTYPLECLLVDMDIGTVLHYAVDINNAGQILTSSHIEDEDGRLEYFAWLLTPTDALQADLHVEKSVDEIVVYTGAEITYAIAVRNQGPDQADDVRLSEVIPANQRLVSVSSTQGTCEATDGTLNCELESLAAGASLDLHVITEAVVSGALQNRAVATSATLELNPASNHAAVLVTVKGGDPVQHAADVAAGETGEVDLSEAGMLVDLTTGSSTSGALNAAMYHEEPENSQDLPLVTVQAYGGEIEPDSVLIERYWTLEADNLHDYTLNLCLNISGLSGVDPEYLVIAKRSNSDDTWTVYDATLRTIGNTLYLCVQGLTDLSQLAIATEGRMTEPEPHSFTFDLPSGWSLVSLPVTPTDGSLAALFPTALSAFAYDGSYQQLTQLEPGQGYWVNLETAHSSSITGSPVAHVAKTLPAGWSLIGVPWGGIAKTAIERTPADILTSVFGYSDGYYEADPLAAGQGYWVNLSEPGTLSLTGGAGLPKQLADAQVTEALPTDSHVLWVESGTHRQALRLGVSPEAVIALPPRPPAGTFDVRLRLDGVEAWQAPITAEPRAYPVLVQGEAIRFHWTEPTPGEAPWELVINDQTIALTGTGMVAVDEARDVVFLHSPGSSLPRALALHQNLPNPFNAQTFIGYYLPAWAEVSLTIFNLLGQPVRTLVTGEQPAGVHRVVWDGLDDRGRPVASGVYVYRLKAGRHGAVRRMVVLR